MHIHIITAGENPPRLLHLLKNMGIEASFGPNAPEGADYVMYPKSKLAAVISEEDMIRLNDTMARVRDKVKACEPQT